MLANTIAMMDAWRGWKRRGAAFAAGVGGALAQAPFYFLPLFAVAICVLLVLLKGAQRDEKPQRSAFMIGWFFGLGYFLLGLYWMALSFFVQAEQYAWMSPFAALGMPSFLGLFYGAACAVTGWAWRARRVTGWRRVVVFALFFMIVEYLRGHILTGLPWNLPGQALAGTAMGIQTAAYWGAYGLSLVVVLLAAAPVACLLDEPATGESAKGKEGLAKDLLAGVAVMVIGVVALFGFGAARLSMTTPGVHDDVVVRIVQPNIPQKEKIDPSFWGRNVGRALALSAPSSAASSQETPSGRLYVIWPENTAPLVDEYPEALKGIGVQLPANTVLLSGAVRRDVSDEGETRFYNAMSILANTPAGMRPIDYYDKHHLVPFGEYLPLKGLLKALGLAQLAPFEDGFKPGPGPRTFSAGGVPFSPLICYETIFPGAIHPRENRPEWLVTVTNDAWFGDSSGPRQHLDQARLRSVETGLPMARAANTGVSVLIDAAGRYLGRVALYQPGVISHALPRAIKPTVYAHIGDFGFLILMIVVAIIGVSPVRIGAKNVAE